MIKFAGSRQQGVALIMVLLAMALVVLMASGMTRQQSLRVFKAGHYLAQQQGQSIALGAEEFAKRILVRDYEEDKENSVMVDSPDEFWAMHAAILPLDDSGVAEVQIDDLGGRINLNDLVTASGEVDPITKDRLTRLFRALGITGLTVDPLIDWMDADDQAISAYGAEDGQYLMADPPYRTGNQPFVSITELRLIEGMTEEIYAALRPHLVALPVSGVGINVNTATAQVLMSLHEDMNEAQAESIIAKREEERFENLQDFLALPEFSGMGLKANGLTLQTRFFEVVSRITYDNRVVNMVSTVYRNPEGEVRTVHRDTGQKNRITKEPYTFSEG
ncbi:MULTISPECIES: type II secretion system minor pseudopilin GspK [Marinobacter]|jgi:general secretion pathway protein K|uniref:type II secretion system minor pseudopilin GspK n=1 Tax=Marinobacter TaxID=2742 RepID=UPI000256EBA5|nr:MULTISPECIES: type II secretion system minor pseudopilin GspK [Marinobacter]MCG8522572.1 type II secretion system minor pseudopilin GspK [Pseudomonadales bacterium]ERS12045.1 general secretion pathway protein K [Marinobacter sp. EN3]MBN8238307.1 type II secretion system minor pseudopilin GspK [Marinobacter nauticus]MBW3196246.1 type II secretion system minor pseudopilin GspK [Marinobacter nauticus]MBY5961606.1 type II secretion system minor pseudopilin GspK [Marinobacter nauticus]